MLDHFLSPPLALLFPAVASRGRHLSLKSISTVLGSLPPTRSGLLLVSSSQSPPPRPPETQPWLLPPGGRCLQTCREGPWLRAGQRSPPSLGEQMFWWPWHCVGWSLSFLAPCKAGETPGETRLVLSPAVTERHQGTLSHEIYPSEVRHPSQGTSHTRNDTFSEDVICSEELTCLSPHRGDTPLRGNIAHRGNMAQRGDMLHIGDTPLRDDTPLSRHGPEVTCPSGVTWPRGDRHLRGDTPIVAQPYPALRWQNHA